MKKQPRNPYLPLWEYVPDGEPHVFEGRLFVYGSHDRFGAFPFCDNPYVAWSCPVSDLSDWRYEGVIYPRDADPDNPKGRKCLFAPDVTRGPDGRYYLYYSFAWSGTIGVAVSSRPEGPFTFLGHVSDKEGKVLGRRRGDPFLFDPGVLTDEDGKVYLYAGFGPVTWFPQIPLGHKASGAYVFELEPDMVTVRRGPVLIASKAGDRVNLNGAPREHAFFEASSIRHFHGHYYFVYSSLNGDELCYMTSDSPFGPFRYQGVLVSSGDVGYEGRKRKEADYPLGNNHGSLVEVNGKFYVFYHRHTNYTNTDRQGMAEEVQVLPNGTIPQVEKTCGGLSGGVLPGEGTYPASLCTMLLPRKGNGFYPFARTPLQERTKTYLTQSGKDSEQEETQYVHNVQDGLLLGYRYFDLSSAKEVVLTLSGKGRGTVSLSFAEKGGEEASAFFQGKGKEKTEVRLPLSRKGSKEALFFRFRMKGKIDLFSLRFESGDEKSGARPL